MRLTEVIVCTRIMSAVVHTFWGIFLKLGELEYIIPDMSLWEMDQDCVLGCIFEK